MKTELWSLDEAFEKSRRVKGAWRRTKSGKLAWVPQHTDRRAAYNENERAAIGWWASGGRMYGQVNPEMEDRTDSFLTALKRTNNYSGPAYRGISVTANSDPISLALLTASVGDKFLFENPISTSKDYATGADFATMTAFEKDKPLLLKFNLRHGADFGQEVGDEWEPQHEVVIHPGSRFRVIAVRDMMLDDWKAKYVELEQM
jgi:hypothetical protein